MSRRKIKAGSTSQVVPFFVQDTTSTTGAGLGSLVYNTSGLAAKYRRQGDASWTTITLATATAGTFTSSGFIADGGPVTGGYELGVPNAALAAGATWCQIAIYGAANMLPVLIEFELDAIDYQGNPKVDVDTIKTNPVVNGGTVTFPTGATLASTTNITAASGCAVSSIGTDVINSTALAASAVTEIWASVADSSGVTTLLSRLSSARAGYLDNINNSALASVPAFPSNFPSLGINASGHISRVTLADTTTTNTDMLTSAAVATAVLGSTIETGKTLTQCIRAIAAAAAGKRSNCGTTSEQYDAIGNAGTARIVVNADADGNGTPTLSL